MTSKFLVLGAGASGLAFAHAMRSLGERSVLVLEQEHEAGGLCRSAEVGGAPLDIGGGHFLDLRRPAVLEFLFKFMPRSEWQEHERVAKIRLGEHEVEHPLEANLWQLPMDEQVDFLESIARSGSVRGEPRPESFEPWIRWKFGARIADSYMAPYNEKIWSMPLGELSTDWLHKLPAVSFAETLRSCLERRSLGVLPAHGRFLYPRHHGYGEVWRRMGAELGDQLITGCRVESIDLQERVVNGRFRAEWIINTIPWKTWTDAATLPVAVTEAIGSLRHVGIDIDHIEENVHPQAHWIYEPDLACSYHRLLCRSNFVPGSFGGWSETNAKRSPPARGWRHHNAFAYPVNTRTKAAALETIFTWANAMRITPLGRWGRWEHLNSDVAVDEAIRLAHTMLGVPMRR
jgi:protoporphyrinogen oxidase